MSCGERDPQRLVGHGVAAVLDHDDLAVEAVQPGQRLDQRGRLGQRARPLPLAARRDDRGSCAGRSCRVRRVLVHVGGGQVGGAGSWRRAGPADRSTVMVTSRGRRSTLDRSSPGAAVAADPDPVDRDVEPRPARTSALVVPTAASTRPQFGSSPAMAHLSRLRPGDGAADGERVVLAGRADHLDRDRLGGALGVGLQLAGQVGADVGEHARRTRPGPGAAPDAPLASSSTVSLVDMQPSVSSRSKVTRGRRRAARRPGSAGVQVGVGGEHARAWWPARARACPRPWPCRRSV